ncbi:MAG: transposase [Bacteroidales bacterium]|nr:transposase [Bacteroidales bacterium]
MKDNLGYSNITHAWLTAGTLKHWATYYKWVESGRWSWVNIVRRLTRLITVFFPEEERFLALDDTLFFRVSKKVPGNRIYHQYGTKENRPQYVRGQNWVCLAKVVHGFGKASISLLSRMMRKASNSSKLDAAKLMIRAIALEFVNEKVTLLTDSWYICGTLIKYVLNHNFQVIGQVRKDTALYDIPKPIGKRGRPRIYGDKYTSERVFLMPATVRKIELYGRMQEVSFKSVVICARFLKGQAVRVVWV